MLTTFPAAVVLDCDGTLADTETISDATWEALLARRGLELTAADVGAVKGRPWHDVWGHYVGRFPSLADEGADAFRRALTREFVARFEAGARLFPDAVALVRDLHDAAVPLAVCSSSGRRHLERVASLDASLAAVAAWVGREDTDEHKPRPAPYLEAARRLAVAPSACVAVEDTPLGATAALAAGMVVVAIDRGHTAPVGSWPDGVHVVDRLDVTAVSVAASLRSVDDEHRA